jgi:hypothetical protein
VHLDAIKFLFYPTDAQLNIPRKMLKHTLKPGEICQVIDMASFS